MGEKSEALRRRAEKAEAKALEFARKAQAAKRALSEIERNAETRRKIIDGAHIQTEALNSPEIAALLHRLREEKLILDHDRALFGLAPLSEDEKAKRATVRAAGRRSVPTLVETEMTGKSAAGLNAAFVLKGGRRCHVRKPTSPAASLPQSMIFAKR